MKRYLLLVLVGVIILSLVISGCDNKTTVIRIATDATWPPFEYVDEDTKDIVGFDIDLINAIAEKEGLEIEIINVAWDPLLAGMAQCTYDAAISAMTITEERAEQFLFSDPYFFAGQIITVQIDNTDINSKYDLSGKVVGAQIGTTGAIEVEKIGGATLRTYDDIGLAMQDLMNGQIDAVVADNPLALSYVGENPDELKTVGDVFTDENYGIAICKDNTELQAQINSGLEAVMEEGLIDDLVEEWLVGD
ncbi:MAG: basic amino acid ABC transporter substrate-binding protein [Dehalococcoidales bacterium]|nr:MAG: basic amino acid ABC transporter substrate-binding protein [Dehalococcoidales bacterium]